MKKSTSLAILLSLAFCAGAQNWKWVRGTDTSGTLGSYGTKGVAASGNDPGGRHGSATWTDKAGNLWLFGGEGYSNSGTLCWMNDLWKYDKTANQWTWMRGSNGPNSSGSYGTMGVPSNGNEPSAREFAMAWTDTAGIFWMFGGDAYDSGSNSARQAGDLWKYDPATNQWTWVKGYNTFDQYGVYNTMGTANATSLPGCRNGGATWVDANNRLWFFGGRGWGANGSLGYLNDIWRYEPTTNQWTWINGSNAIMQISSYGTVSVTATSNHPSGRGFTGAWLAKTGNVYIFGGIGYVLNSTGTATIQSRLGDFWKYDPSTNNWTWMTGFSVANQNGNYGIYGQPSSSVQPGCRFSPASWVDALGKLWMFGGNGYPGAGNIGQLNDLLSYNVSTGYWTMVKGDTLANKSGIYGTMGTFAASNKPGGREYNNWWRNTGSSLWLMGGEGWDRDSAQINHMNDLWLYNAPCNPDSVSVSGGQTLCNGNTATLSIVPVDNSGVTWYSSPTSSVALGSGTAFVTPTLSAGSSGTTYTYYVTAATCSQSARTAITITALPAPVILVDPPQVACANVPLTFTASGAQSYTWNPGNVVSSVYSLTSLPGTVTTIVTGKDQNGCTSSATSSIVVNPNPTISVSGPSVQCSGTQITATASGASSYSWSNGSTGSTCSMIAGPPGSVIFIDVYGTDSNGCQSSSSMSVSVIPSPTLITKASSSVVCNPHTATLTATGASTYSWSSGQITSVITHSATTLKTYTFTVTGTGTNGCTSTATLSYIRSECIGINEAARSMPLLIYPNPSEGWFFIDMPDNLEQGTITIVNTLGQLLLDKKILQRENKLEVNLPSGMYQCSFIADDGINYQSKLIIR
jgi:N-acetylneuraminic acid mutarotase